MPLDRSTPLKWTAITVRVLLVLFAVVMIYEVGRAALTGGENAYGSFGTRSLVCTPAPAPGVVKDNIFENPQRLKALSTAKGTVDDTVYPLENGVDFITETTDLCKDDSSFSIQLMYQSSRFATALMLLAALLLLDRLIRDARRESGFDEVVVRRLRFLGVFLGVGTLVASLYTTAVETGLAMSMVASPIKSVWEMALYRWDFPWAFLIAGLGLVVMAKVVRVGAHMREELQGTI